MIGAKNTIREQPEWYFYMYDSFKSDCLDLVQSGQFEKDGVILVTLAHNEILLVEAFIKHYRALGVTQFFVVDDRSSDGTLEYLKSCADVTLFSPKPASQFKNDICQWRCDILDHFADSRWAITADVDEHLNYVGMQNSDVNQLCLDLETEGSDAMLAIMIDMYDDLPLVDHMAKGGPLEKEFPFFDAPDAQRTNYRIAAPNSRFRREFPTPPIEISGGARERIFGKRRKRLSGFSSLFRRFTDIGSPLNPSRTRKIINLVVRFLTKSQNPKPKIIINKLALIRWRAGMTFSRAPHSINKDLKLSDRLGAYLHFAFAKGISDTEYHASRAQHAGDGARYKMIISNRQLCESSPKTSFSKKYLGPESLAEAGLLRGNSRH